MGKARNPFVRRKDSSGVVDYTVEIPISFKDAEGRPASGTLVNEAQCEVISDDYLLGNGAGLNVGIFDSPNRKSACY